MPKMVERIFFIGLLILGGDIVNINISDSSETKVVNCDFQHLNFGYVNFYK